MPIKRSSASEVNGLIAALASEDDSRREAAIARLAIIGPRAVKRLADALDAGPSPAATIAIIRALERIGDERALAAAGRLVSHRDADVALAALGTVGRPAPGAAAALEAAALDVLVSVALDTARPERLRLAAIERLLELDRAVVAPVLQRLDDDPSSAVRQMIGRGRPAPPEPEDVDFTLPADPDTARAQVAALGSRAPLSRLHAHVDQVRQREAASSDEAARTSWTAVRAALHCALAARGSRIALYDLRETFATAARPVPSDFLSAIIELGDASCIEPLAAACARAPARGWWRARLIDAMREIVRRRRLTRRLAAIQRFAKRWPEIAQEILRH